MRKRPITVSHAHAVVTAGSFGVYRRDGDALRPGVASRVPS